jgi:hypothetical protein
VVTSALTRICVSVGGNTEMPPSCTSKNASGGGSAAWQVAALLALPALLVTTSWIAAPIAAPAPSGRALAVVQATLASGPGGNRALAVAKPVFSGDKIATGKNGEAQIQFEDNTRLVVGPNSTIAIDKFVFNPDQTVGSVALQMTKGAFRFITGNGAKKAYSINTPTATLGIRGTSFDVSVGGSLGTGILVFDGSVEVCNRRTGECTIVNKGCGAVIAAPNGEMNSPRSAAEKMAMIRASFPLVARQSALRSNFRVDTSGCASVTVPSDTAPVIRRASVGGTPPVGVPPGGGTENPPGGGTENPPGGGAGNPPAGSTNPGTSGRTSGAAHSASSNASDNARSNPGNSENSNAGKKDKKSKNK